jgi:hypothetical protein
MTDVDEPPPDRAETRAIELLRLVGSQTPAVGTRFTPQLIARARSQRAIAGPLRALGGLVAALASAVDYVVRSAREERRS